MIRDIYDAELLETLSKEEREHIAIGIELNFGVTLCGDEQLGFVLVAVESDHRIGLDPHTITVGDIWKSAEAIGD